MIFTRLHTQDSVAHRMRVLVLAEQGIQWRTQTVQQVVQEEGWAHLIYRSIYEGGDPEKVLFQRAEEKL